MKVVYHNQKPESVLKTLLHYNKLLCRVIAYIGAFVMLIALAPQAPMEVTTTALRMLS